MKYETQEYWENIVRLTAELNGKRKPMDFHITMHRLQLLLAECNAARDLSFCEVCSVAKSGILHHRNYFCQGRERPEDMLYVCRKCHSRIHADTGERHLSSDRYDTLRMEVFYKMRPDLLKPAYAAVLEGMFPDLRGLLFNAMRVIDDPDSLDYKRKKELSMGLCDFRAVLKEYSHL